MIGRVAGAAGPRLLDADPDPDHNRLVLSIAGAPGAVRDCVFAAVAIAVETIDLRLHSGVHPRVGAADVVPFVPLEDDSLAACVDLAQEFGERVWEELRLPVLFYGAAAPGGNRSLREIRGANPPAPDIGSGRHPSAGCVCIGARRPLIAYNVLLPGVPFAVAARIARSLRASEGGLPGVQALAFQVTLGSQVSMNLIAPDLTSPAIALEAVRERARALGVRAGADEVVGLCPAAFALPAASGAILEGRLAAAALRIAGWSDELADRLAKVRADNTSLLGAAAEIASVQRSLKPGGAFGSEVGALLEHSRRELARVAEA